MKQFSLLFGLLLYFIIVIGAVFENKPAKAAAITPITIIQPAHPRYLLHDHTTYVDDVDKIVDGFQSRGCVNIRVMPASGGFYVTAELY